MLGKEQQIFLSYSSSSKSAVKELVGDLQDLGHRVWFDQELNGGQDWWDQICTSIEKCKFFILAVVGKVLNGEGGRWDRAHVDAIWYPCAGPIALDADRSDGIGFSL